MELRAQPTAARTTSERLLAFMDSHIYPAEPVYREQRRQPRAPRAS